MTVKLTTLMYLDQSRSGAASWKVPIERLNTNLEQDSRELFVYQPSGPRFLVFLHGRLKEVGGTC